MSSVEFNCDDDSFSWHIEAIDIAGLDATYVVGFDSLDGLAGVSEVDLEGDRSTSNSISGR